MFASNAAVYALSSEGMTRLLATIVESRFMETDSQPATTVRTLGLDDELFVRGASTLQAAANGNAAINQHDFTSKKYRRYFTIVADLM
jgi:hypothetical protein